MLLVVVVTAVGGGAEKVARSGVSTAREPCLLALHPLWVVTSYPWLRARIAFASSVYSVLIAPSRLEKPITRPRPTIVTRNRYSTEITPASSFHSFANMKKPPYPCGMRVIPPGLHPTSLVRRANPQPT